MSIAAKIKARRIQAALMRAAYADKNYSRLRSMFIAALQRQVREYVHASSKKVSSATTQKWAGDFTRVQRAMIYAMVQHGWQLAEHEVGHGLRGKSAMDDQYRGKASLVPGPADFLRTADMSRIDRWIKTTSVSASQTSATRLENIFKNTAKEESTPREIAEQILTAGLAQTEARASMLAHTGAIWSYNEGATQRYEDAGVTVVEWLTADDDLRCPFCAEMNGKRIETGKAFFSAGDELSADDLTLKIPGGARGFNVTHPPLHPNCRCTIIPIFEENS
jgi:hypothetical protein